MKLDNDTQMSILDIDPQVVELLDDLPEFYPDGWFIGTPGVAQGSEKSILFFKKKLHGTFCKYIKTPKAEINTISGVSSFLMMPGSNQVKVLPIMEYFNNCPLNYY